MSVWELFLTGLVVGLAVFGWGRVIANSRERKPPKR